MNCRINHPVLLHSAYGLFQRRFTTKNTTSK